MAQKLNIAEQLKKLSEEINEWNAYRLRSERVEYSEKLTCKLLAEKLEVTQATISNVTQDSKFSLIYSIAEEIYYFYHDYFFLRTVESMKNKCEDGSYTEYNIRRIVCKLAGHY